MSDPEMDEMVKSVSKRIAVELDEEILEYLIRKHNETELNSLDEAWIRMRDVDDVADCIIKLGADKEKCERHLQLKADLARLSGPALNKSVYATKNWRNDY